MSVELEFDKLADEMKTLEEAEVRKASELSFTKEQMANHLRGPDHVNAIIKGHLYFEHVLITAIQDALEYPDEVNVRQLSFPAKLNLATALGQLPKEMKTAGSILNDLRNKIAHRIDFEFTSEDRDRLWYALPESLRDTVLDFKQVAKDQHHVVTIHHILVAFLMTAETYRVGRAKDRARSRVAQVHIGRAVKLAAPGMKARGLI